MIIKLYTLIVSKYININIKQTDLTYMCELKVIFEGNVIMEDVTRITVEKDSIQLHGMLGELKTVSGRIRDVNLTKQEAIIDS